MSKQFWHEHDAEVNAPAPSLYHPDGPDAALLGLHLSRLRSHVEEGRLSARIAELDAQRDALQASMDALDAGPLEGNRRTPKGGLSNL